MAVKSSRAVAAAMTMASILLLGASSAWSFSLAPHRALSRPKLTTAGCLSSSSSTTTTPHRSNAVTAAAAAVTADGGDDDENNKDPPLFEPFLEGIVRDYRMRLPLYKSDVTDGLNVQCLAATLFLFFACLAPAVGFGALFGSATNGAIGTMEMVSILIGAHANIIIMRYPHTLPGRKSHFNHFASFFVSLFFCSRCPAPRRAGSYTH